MFRVGVACIAALVALTIAPAGASARSSYCSPTGDYCTATYKKGGVRWLNLRTFSFRGRVDVCVTTPSDEKTCHKFLLRRVPHDIFEIHVRWSRWYPTGERGKHKLRFLQGDSPIGPMLSF